MNIPSGERILRLEMEKRKRWVFNRDELIAKLYPYLFLPMVAGYPLVAGLGIIGRIPGSIPGISFRIATIGLSALMMYLVIGRPGRYLHTGMQWLLGGIWTLLFARILMDTVIAPIPLFAEPWRIWLFAVGVCLLPTFPLFILPEEEWLTKTFRMLMNLGLLAMPAGAIGALMEPKTTYTLRLGGDRISALTLGHLGVSVAIMCGWCIATNYRDRQSTFKLFAGMFGGIGIVALSGSRGPLLALIICFFILLITSVKPARKMPKLTVVGVGLFALGVPTIIVLLSTFTSYNFLLRLAESAGGDEGDTYSRGNVIPKTIEYGFNNPVTGAALNHPEFAIYPHNALAEAFIASGIPGLTILIILLAVELRCAWWLLKNRSRHGWIGLIAIQFVIMLSTSFSIFLEGGYWAMMALTYTIYIYEKRRGLGAAPSAAPVTSTPVPG